MNKSETPETTGNRRIVGSAIGRQFMEWTAAKLSIELLRLRESVGRVWGQKALVKFNTSYSRTTDVVTQQVNPGKAAQIDQLKVCGYCENASLERS